MKPAYKSVRVWTIVILTALQIFGINVPKEVHQAAAVIVGQQQVQE